MQLLLGGLRLVHMVHAQGAVAGQRHKVVGAACTHTT